MERSRGWLRHRPKHVAEYAAVRLFGGLVRALPFRVALGVGWGVAWVMHYLVRFRAAEARRRLRQVFGDEMTEREVRRVAWRSWRNLCFSVVEMVRLPDLTREDAQRIVVNWDEGERVLRSRMRDGRGVVLAAPHAGSWDMAGIVCHLVGLPMFFIARRQKNPLVDDYMNRMRGSTGVETVLNDESVLRSVIRRLKQGRILAILPDVRARTPALPISFLGGTANLGGGMAMLARQAQVPIQVGVVLREGWTRHRWRLLEPVIPDPTLDKQTDWQRMTQAVIDQFETEIRRHPDQYFWYNKRWVLDPLGPTTTEPPADPASAILPDP